MELERLQVDTHVAHVDEVREVGHPGEQRDGVVDVPYQGHTLRPRCPGTVSGVPGVTRVLWTGRSETDGCHGRDLVGTVPE